ncbi:MAG: glycosyltransferase family 9 protein [Nitrospiraceae bacterium]|nr:glycosyltransferase family 9 protein [Nitrospiraceae bacterium]
MTRTIIMIHPGALGDVLLALPAIQRIQWAFSGHHLGLVAKREVSRLLTACGRIHAAFPIETQALSGLLTKGKAIHPVVQHWLERCDIAVCWMADPENHLRSVFEQAGVRLMIIQSARSSACRETHQEDRLLEMVAPVISGSKDIQLDSVVQAYQRSEEVRLSLPREVLAQGQAELETMGMVGSARRLIVVHPGSGSRHKCGEPSLFASLIAWCQQSGMTPILIKGPADDEMAANVLNMCTNPPMILTGETLLAVAGVLAHAHLFVGHDSGMTHLAAALHLPTVALFGPTDAQRWAPRGTHVTVITGGPCSCGGWETVQACRDKPCLRVSVQTLIEACRQALNHELHRPSAQGRLVMSKDLC